MVDTIHKSFLELVERVLGLLVFSCVFAGEEGPGDSRVAEQSKVTR